MNFLMWRAFLQCWVFSKCLAEPFECVCVYMGWERERDGKIVCVCGWVWQCKSLYDSLSVSKCVFEGVCLCDCSGAVGVKVCFRVSLCVCESLSVWVCVSESLPEWMFMLMCMCMFVCRCLGVCVSLSECVSFYVCVCLSVCVSVCVGLTLCVCAVWVTEK